MYRRIQELDAAKRVRAGLEHFGLPHSKTRYQCRWFATSPTDRLFDIPME
jgi:hypothetical protein